MTPKQTRFVAEYLKDLNATQAAIRTGYAPRTANREGSRLLSNVDIAAAIAAGTGQQLATAELSAARVLEELRRLGLSDPRGYWTETGDLKPIKDLTAEQASCLAGFEVVIKNAKAGDGQTDTVHKIKFWDKTRALEQLAKHFGLLVDKVEHSGGVEFHWQAPPADLKNP